MLKIYLEGTKVLTNVVQHERPQYLTKREAEDEEIPQRKRKEGGEGEGKGREHDIWSRTARDREPRIANRKAV